MSNSSTNSWSYDEFLCYLMIFAANADDHFHDKEKEFILEKSGQAAFDKMVKAWNDSDEMTRTQLIFAYKEQHFHTEEDGRKALGDLKKVYMADGVFDESEQEQMAALEEVLL